MSGKGDKPRPVDPRKWDENYARIFRSVDLSGVPSGRTWQLQSPDQTTNGETPTRHE